MKGIVSELLDIARIIERQEIEDRTAIWWPFKPPKEKMVAEGRDYYIARIGKRFFVGPIRSTPTGKFYKIFQFPSEKEAWKKFEELGEKVPVEV